MTRFEYLSVLVSIIVALGLSEMIQSAVRLVRHRARVRFYWVHSLWMAVAALLLIQFWWGFWSYRGVQTWSLGGLVALVVCTVVLVVAALFLTPGEIGEGLDLRRFYEANAPLCFGAAMVYLSIVGLVDAAVGHQPLLHAENAIRLLGVGVVGWAALSRNEVLHGGLAVAGAVLVLAFTAVSFDAGGP